MLMFVCLSAVLALASASPSANQQAADYLQAGLQGPAGFKKMSSQSIAGAPGQQGAYYRPKPAENLPTVTECPDTKCHLALSIILDDSGSVGAADFDKELVFTRAIIEILTVKAKEVGLAVCLGVVKYSSNAAVTVNPCCGLSMCQVIDKFVNKEIAYDGGSTNTAGALKVARQMLQATSSYKKLALLITDGRSNVGGSPASIAKSMREEDGITILALGVTSSINKAELMSISGDSEVRDIADFDKFEELAELLLESNQMTSDELSSNIDDICANDVPNLVNAVDGGWGNWSADSCQRRYRKKRMSPRPMKPVGPRYGECYKTKRRQCNSPAPQCGGVKCDGDYEVYSKCECPDDGGYTPYGYHPRMPGQAPGQQKIQSMPGQP